MVAPPPARNQALKEASEEYLTYCRHQVAAKKLSTGTHRLYQADIADMVDLLGADTPIDDITATDVSAAVAAYALRADRRYTLHPEKAPTLNSNTIHRFHNTLTRFFTHAEEHHWVQLSPARAATPPPPAAQPHRPERAPLNTHQLQALLKYGAGSPAEQTYLRPWEQLYARDTALLHIMAKLGPTVSEIVAANDEDIFTLTHDDGTTGTYWDIRSTHGHIRRIKLSDEIRRLIDDYRSTRPTPDEDTPKRKRDDARRALFRSGRGLRLNPRDLPRVTDRAYRYVKDADASCARRVTPHALRHTAALTMIQNGWDLQVVADMLGYSSIASLQRHVFLGARNPGMKKAPGGAKKYGMGSCPLVRGDTVGERVQLLGKGSSSRMRSDRS